MIHKVNSKLSVITVVLNDFIGIEKTIKSVIEQDFHDIEFIIIDGGSTDGTKEIIERYLVKISHYYSEPDKGLFHAMNKGLNVATGEWVNFLNAGDIFLSPETVSNVGLCGSICADVIYGDMISDGAISKAPGMANIRYGEINACHQSMFFSNKFLQRFKLKYNENYKIYSDYDFVAKIFKLGGIFYYINSPLVIYETGGISSNISWQKRRDKYLSIYNNFGIFYLILAVFYRFYLGATNMYRNII